MVLFICLGGSPTNPSVLFYKLVNVLTVSLIEPTRQVQQQKTVVERSSENEKNQEAVSSVLMQNPADLMVDLKNNKKLSTGGCSGGFSIGGFLEATLLESLGYEF